VSAVFATAKPIFIEENAGKGNALRTGFEACRGSHVLFLDADLNITPEQGFRMFDIMEKEHADAVIGSKRHPESNIRSYPWQRRVASATYYFIVKTLFGMPLRDTQTGIKLFKRAVLQWSFQRMLEKRFAIDLELLAVAQEKGFKIAEAPVTLTGEWGALRLAVVWQIINDTLAIFYRRRLLGYYGAFTDLRQPEPPPLVSVVVAFASPTRCLDECLDGLRKQTYTNYEVILLPDAPTGRTWPKGTREIATGPVRPARKRNIGIENARGNVVAFIDDDAFPEENWLQAAAANFSIAETAAVGGPSITPGNDSRLARFGGEVYANPLVSGTYRYRYTIRPFREVDDYPSCNLTVRTDVLRRLGGYRTDFWPGEDTYLCMEITGKLGLKIVYDPRVLVYHHRRRLFLPHLRQIARYALHRGYFARKFPATSRRLSYMIPSLFVLGIVFGAALSVACPLCQLVYLWTLAAYTFITLLSCFRLNPASWLIVWLGIVSTHLVYGVGFLAGLFTRRLPDEVSLEVATPAKTGKAPGDVR
jgi:glycosyltransferase involved in cell wall biosynthesis